MPLPMIDQVAEFNANGVAMLQKILDEIRAQTPAIRYVAVAPTTATIQLNEFVVMDDGAGTKKLFVRTAQGNLGEVTLV